MNIIYGTVDSEVIFGTTASDWIFGLAGIDAIHGDAGKDIYTPGADGASKSFQDFEDGSDLIDIRDWGVTSFDQLVFTQIEPNKVRISTLDGSLYINVFPMDPNAPTSFDATDFIFSGTPLYTYSPAFDEIDVTQNEYAVHFGNGGVNWLNLERLVSGSATGIDGARVFMDNDLLNNGKFTVGGVTQHFFDFQNIRGTNGRDSIVGSQGDNNLVGLKNADTIHGGGGDDNIFGNVGADLLYGDDGDDVLNGGRGYDQLWGGEGDDVFVFVSFDSHRDLVRNFEDGKDRLDISQWGANSIADLIITDLGAGGVSVRLATGPGLGFEVRSQDISLTAAALTDADFIFT